MNSPVKEIDLCSLSIQTHPLVQSVPYKCNINTDQESAGSIKLFMFLALLYRDHAISYYFFDNATVEEVSYFVKNNPAHYGSNVVVIDTGESFNTNEEVESRAKQLKAGSETSNVYLPVIVLRYATKSI